MRQGGSLFSEPELSGTGPNGSFLKKIIGAKKFILISLLLGLIGKIYADT